MLNVHSFIKVVQKIEEEKIMISNTDAAKLIQIYLDEEKHRKQK